MQSSLQQPTLFTIRTDLGDEYASCHGQFAYDASRGYTGHYFLADYRPKKPGPWFFDVPDELTRPFIPIETEDGHYATICFARIRQRSWRNLRSLRVEIAFSYLLHDVGLDEDEASISALRISCPTLASIADVRPVVHSFNMPNTGGTATFNLSTKQWEGTNFAVEIGDQRQIGGKDDSSEVHFRSDICLALRYREPRLVSQVLQHLRALDDLLSVMSGRYVSIKNAWLEVVLDEKEQREFKLTGYGTGNQAIDFVGQHETLSSLGLDSDWHETVSRFLRIWDEHEIAFKWFRSSQINKRYLEEQFSYAVRVIERYFKNSSTFDPEAEWALATLLQRTNGDLALAEFVQKRIAPVLTRSASLGTILRALYARYPAIKAFAETRPQAAIRLRGKEMHGADSNYSADEYGEMYALTNSFMLAFRLAILEECGFDQMAILERARNNKFRTLLTA